MKHVEAPSSASFQELLVGYELEILEGKGYVEVPLDGGLWRWWKSLGLSGFIRDTSHEICGNMMKYVQMVESHMSSSKIMLCTRDVNVI